MQNSATMETGAAEDLPFVFTGKAKEFFSIWIVNIALTLVTLGIYSAWAKVRTNRYFYGNTRLDEVSFRYLADPKQILKGRIVAFALFMAYYFSGLVSPAASAGMLLVLMLLFPAFLVMSMAFRLRNSSWRNVRFDFRKDFKKAYAIFAIPVAAFALTAAAMLYYRPEQQAAMSEAEAQAQAAQLPLLVALAPLLLMLLFPWVEYLVTRFRVVNARYGEADFSFKAGVLSYYGMYIVAFLILLLAGVLAGVLMTGLTATLALMLGGGAGNAADAGNLPGQMALFAPLLMLLVVLPFYLWAFAYLQTRRTNLIFNNMRIDDHRLQCNLEVSKMLGLYVTNTLAILVSLGLLIPWAKIRTARYRASRTRLLTQGNLNAFANAQRERQSAMGEEIGEMLDMDLGF